LSSGLLRALLQRPSFSFRRACARLSEVKHQ
jgi:hypothetical protein